MQVHDEERSLLAQWLPVLKRWWYMVVQYWYLFVISTALCLLIGWYYGKVRTQYFREQAMMLIEDAETLGGSSSNGAVNTLLQLNGVSAGNNLVNEGYIMTTRRLMRNVVDTLKLNVDYTAKPSMRRVTLYKERPFVVEFATADVEVPVAFDAEIEEGGMVRLSNFSSKDNDEEISVRTGVLINTPVGALRIVRQKDFAQFPKGLSIRVTRYPIEMATDMFQNKISAEPYDKNSSLLQLTCVDLNAERAGDVLVQVFEAYKRDVVDNKNRVALGTAHFIDERIAIIGQELGNVENRMAQFKRDNQVVDLQQSASVAVTESSVAKQKALQLETELSVAKYLMDFLVSHAHENEVIPVLSGGDMGSYGAHIAEYNRLVLQRNQTLTNTTASSPAVKQFDAQLAALRSSILSAVRSQVNALGLELRDARKVESATQGVLNNAPLKEKKALDIQRQQELKNALYTYLLNKREEVGLQLSINEANVRLVEYPHRNSAPIYQPITLILLIATVVGLLLPLIYLLLKDLLNNTIASRQEVEQLVSIPVLGEIPHWEEKGAERLIDKISPSSPIVEAFRILRFNLGFIGKNIKVIAVTSSTPSQGKTFIVSNFATAIAMAGKRVVVIDTDIRKRTLSKNYRHVGGLTSYLTGESVTLSDIVVTDGLTKGVDMIPAGLMPPNPSELLLSPRLAQLLDEAKQRYDHVIVDTTPFLSVADSSIVCQQADATIYNLRVGVQPRGYLPYLQKLYDTKRIRNLVLLVNDSDERTTSYGYGYGYVYGYSQDLSIWERIKQKLNKKIRR